MVSRRQFRLGLALVAAILHLAVPVGAYAWASPSALPSDFCSTNRATPAGGGELPAPASSEHHCAHAPCCASTAAHAAAPPPAATGSLFVALAQVRAPSGSNVGTRVIAIAGALPRGPPPLS